VFEKPNRSSFTFPFTCDLHVALPVARLFAPPPPPGESYNLSLALRQPALTYWVSGLPYLLLAFICPAPFLAVLGTINLMFQV
jgi:hypothetical protein